MDQGDPALARLPEPGEPVFYPKVGHCVYRGLTEDRAAPGKKLVELEDLEEGSRILIPTERVPKLGLRPAGKALEEIQQELSSEFEHPLEEVEGLNSLIQDLVSEGSPRNLAKGLKRLHLLRQTTGLSREEEQTRRKIRSWLAAEVALSKDCTRAEAQALITRILQEAMNAHRRREREEAKERRRQVKAQKAAEDRALKAADDASPEDTLGQASPEGEAQEGAAQATPEVSEERAPEVNPEVNEDATQTETEDAAPGLSPKVSEDAAPEVSEAGTQEAVEPEASEDVAEDRAKGEQPSPKPS